MTICDFNTNELEKIEVINKSTFSENGHLRRITTDGNNIIFICAKAVFVYNMINKKIEYSVENDDCVCASIIDNNLWLCTWNGVFKYKVT